MGLLTPSIFDMVGTRKAGEKAKTEAGVSEGLKDNIAGTGDINEL